ncbi:MAG: AP endonuclease [Treponema sp.]|jgi:hypothetical protein|nr:AP endonuclease [Treponema sp.]
MILSVPSWVIPGSYRENLQFLEDKPAIQGVELLFFLYDGEVKKLLNAEWEAVTRFSQRFTITAHLPNRILPEHEELVERLFPWTRHFIVHPYPDSETDRQKKLLETWTARYGGHANPFLIENTYPGWLESLLAQLPGQTRLCMDTGHLLLAGNSPAAFFKQYQDRLAEIHLHDVDWEASDGRLLDHRPLNPKASWLQALAPELKGFTGVVNLEVFSWEETKASLAALQTLGAL